MNVNRKTKLKMNRLKFNLKRYVFSGRYFVRNALIVMILLTFIAIGAVGISVLSSMKEEQSGEEIAEQSQKEDVILDSRLTIKEPSMIGDISREELIRVIEEEKDVEVTAKDISLLANTRKDNYSGFLCKMDEVNVRAAADGSSEIVGRLSAGAAGEVIETDGAWTKISSGDVTGYVTTTFLVLGEEASLREEETIGTYATTNGVNVCIRKEGSTEADLVYISPVGTRMTVDTEESGNGWYAVRLADGTCGYVSADYVDITEEKITAVSMDEIRAVTDWKDEQIRKEEEKKEEAMKADLYLLAAITYCEAGVEPYEGQLAVANVVLNRLHSGKYGSTLEDVIYAPYQFTGCQLSSFSWALQTGGSESCLQAAREALEGHNNIGDCLYFRATWVADLGAIGDYTIIGTHVFY
ncbi:MAG: cell wall hydrolase [Eubacterium sp.]|nr:cell wall hydrolase [Eubacterium sp.]